MGSISGFEMFELRYLGKGIDHTKPFKNGPVDIGFDTYFGTPSNE